MLFVSVVGRWYRPSIQLISTLTVQADIRFDIGLCRRMWWCGGSAHCAVTNRLDIYEIGTTGWTTRCTCAPMFSATKARQTENNSAYRKERSKQQWPAINRSEEENQSKYCLKIDPKRLPNGRKSSSRKSSSATLKLCRLPVPEKVGRQCVDHAAAVRRRRNGEQCRRKFRIMFPMFDGELCLSGWTLQVAWVR